MLISRNARGRLDMRTLDVQALFDMLFAECKTAKEVEWVHEQLFACLEGRREEADQRVEPEQEDEEGSDS